MKQTLALFLFLYSLCLFGQSSRTFVPASDAHLSYVGRFSFADPSAVRFTYPAAQIYARFTGTSVAMKVKPGCGYFMIELDDRAPYKVHADEGSDVVDIAGGLDGGAHTLHITYANEGLVMKPIFYGLLLDADGAMCDAPQLPERKMEFIGNSITCGLGNEGSPSDKRALYSKQNTYYTYEAFAARALNAQYQVVARSGIGLYRNCNGKRTGDRGTMRDLFPHTLFGTSGEQWDFSRYQPDVVCVNLGTNDTTNPGYDAALLTAEFKKFVVTLRGHYPHAKIVLLSGCMLKGQRLADVKGAMDAAAADAHSRGDSAVYRFDFTPDDGSLGYGIYKHPSVAKHKSMAEELIPFIKEITGWE